LNLSYGMGQVFVVPYEEVMLNGQTQRQGAMCALPIPRFPTGVMRGRFHSDGHLYGCGMYAWAGNQQKPGGLYRIRYLGNAAWLPRSIQYASQRVILEFSNELHESATDRERYVISAWDIERSANYGSEHLNPQSWQVTAVKLRQDRRFIELTVPDLKPTRGLEIKCRVQTPDGREVTRVLHGTIHLLEQP
jgi:hypothetical protein